MNKCNKCDTLETSKWYSNKTECRNCYRSRNYIKREIKQTNKKCLNCNSCFVDSTLGQNKKYCNKSCGSKFTYACKHAEIKTCKSCNNEFNTKVHYKEYCDKKCYTSYYKKNLAKPLSENEKLKHNIRNRLNQAIKGSQKTGSAVDDLGCSIEELKLHLEARFLPEMSWDNYGLHGWHIDHIKPLAKFDLSNPIKFKEAVHYTNLQPLWAKDNLSKGTKTPEETENICH